MWQETGGGAAGGELHVNLRGYPGRTTIPDCTTGDKDNIVVKCFAEPERHRQRERDQGDRVHREPGRRPLAHRCWSGATTAGCTPLSEHVAPPLDLQPRRSLPEARAEQPRADQAEPAELMKLTRRDVIVGAAAGAVGATGIYELVDRLAGVDPGARSRHVEAARAASARRHPGRAVGRHSGARAAAPSRADHRAHRGRPLGSRRRAPHARARARRARCRVREHALPGSASRSAGASRTSSTWFRTPTGSTCRTTVAPTCRC